VGRLLAWVGVALGAAYLVFIGGGWLGIYTPDLRIATDSLAAIVLAAWAWMAWRNPESRPRSVLLPAIVASLASLAISTVFARDQRVSVEYLGYAILLAALYLFLVRLMASPFFRSRLVTLSVVLFVAISVEFTAFVLYLWLGWWADVGHVTIPPLRPNFIGLSWGNPSAILTIVALLAVPTAARFVSWRRRGLVTLIAIGVTVAVVAVLTASRTGWLGLAIAGLLGAIVFLAGPDRRARLRMAMGSTLERPIGRPAKIGLVVVGAAVVVGLVILIPSVASRLQEGGEDNRIGFYVAAIRMFSASPLFGTGLGSWVIQRQAFMTPNQIDEYVPYAHDVPLQTLAEQGLVGALAGAILLASLAWLVISAARSSDSTRSKWGWLTGLGLVYFGINNLLDVYTNMPAVLLAAAIPVAWLDATTEGSPQLRGIPWPTAPSRWASIVAAALVVISLVGVLSAEVPAMQFEQAVALADKGDWANAYPLARQVAANDPAIGPYQLLSGLASAHEGHPADAIAAFEKVASRDDLPEAWIDLAAEQAAVGDDGGARASIVNGLRLGSQHSEVALPAGDLALKLGLTDVAVDAFAAAISADTTLAGDPWWHADPAREVAFNAAVEKALPVMGPDGAWRVTLEMGDLAQAQRDAAASSDPATAMTIIAAWAGDPSAIQRVFANCTTHPLDLDAVIWCARFEFRQGNPAAAKRWLDVAAAINAGSPATGLELRVVGGQPGLLYEAAYSWSVYTYRTYGPLDMLVPSLVHVHLE